MTASLQTLSPIAASKHAKVVSGVLLSPTIESGVVVDLTGVAYNSAIYGVENALSGGQSTNAVVYNNGVLNVGLADSPAGKFQNAVAQLTTVHAGGIENVFAYGRSMLTHVEGGVQNIHQGGIATGARIDAGAQQVIYAGGEAYKSADAGLVEVLAGGTALDISLLGGQQQVFGYADYTQVGAGAVDLVESGGVAQGSILSGTRDTADFATRPGFSPPTNGWGMETVLSGGVSDDATVNFGGVLDVSWGGVANGANVNASGVEEVLGQSNNATFHGGLEWVVGTANTATLSGASAQIDGVANYQTLLNGAFAQVDVGGVSNFGTVLASEEDVFGVSYSETVGQGGRLVVYDSAAANDDAVTAGGALTVRNGAVSNNGFVNGGAEDVYGRSHADSIGEGGVLTVHAGGVAEQTVIAGGKLAIENGATATGVSFGSTSGGELALAHGALLVSPLAGFGVGDSLDLQDIAWGATGAKLDVGATSSTLYVSDGVHLDAIHLLGDFQDAALTFGSDGAGGTLVRDTPPCLGANGHAA